MLGQDSTTGTIVFAIMTDRYQGVKTGKTMSYTFQIMIKKVLLHSQDHNA